MKLEPYLSDEIIPDLNNIVRDIEDEGDRCYFGSTNDADRLREIADWLEANFRRTPPASQNDDPLGDGSDYGVTGHWWGTASQSDEALVVEVASILDHPSLFMGGPSRQSTMKARAILPILQAREAAARADEREKALEEAAKYLDQFAPKLVESAAAIRALKGERT